MNDFTKEELEALADCYEQRMNSGYVIHLELLHKIQSMIDNYCEHEWENICCQCDLDKIYCHKCKRTLNDQPTQRI